MPQHLNGDQTCPNPNCEKIVVKATARMAEEIPNRVTPFHHWQKKVVIGRTFFHEDGTLCDVSEFMVKKLQKPAWLHLGDSRRDPRV